jgi:GntR family uxuAB operon transcriptional repressor
MPKLTKSALTPHDMRVDDAHPSDARDSRAANARSPDTRLYRVVAERIQGLIRDESIAPGSRLPSERDLAGHLNVSRASVREALIALELTGVVEVRGGSGIYVSDLPADGPGMHEIGSGPFEILATRRLIESEIAALAARNATDSAVDAILRALDEMERFYDDRRRNEEADRAFHLAIARASGNGSLVEVLDNIWNQRGRLWVKMEEHFQTDELRQETLVDHRRIFEAIATRNPTAARRAMRAHIERVTREFARNWGSSVAQSRGRSDPA